MHPNECTMVLPHHRIAQHDVPLEIGVTGPPPSAIIDQGLGDEGESAIRIPYGVSIGAPNGWQQRRQLASSEIGPVPRRPGERDAASNALGARSSDRAGLSRTTHARWVRVEKP